MEALHNLNPTSLADTLLSLITAFVLGGIIGIERQMRQRTAGLRRPGAAALDLAYVAAGRFDAFYEMGLAPWDVAAGALLVEEAGGFVSNFQGGSSVLFKKEIIAAHPSMGRDFLALVSDKLA
mgnify:CR=1 FL=1